MNTPTLTIAKKAFRLFSHNGADKAQVKYNVTQYLKAMSYLGDKHILAKKIERKVS